MNMDIGTQKQLFIDERFFESTDGVRLCMNPPVQYAEPVLRADRPWEALGIGSYNTVLREADGRFRLWYDALLEGGLPREGARRLCYAESTDGLCWEKPELGLIPFRGSTANNIVAPPLERQSQQGATVLRDERAAPAERYKLWTKFQPTDRQVAAGVEPGLWAMHSADGIHWRVYPGQPNPPDTMCDTQNMLFWDDRLELYVGYTRVRETQAYGEAATMGVELNAAGQGRYRAVGRITSPDLRTWSPLEIVFEADATDLAIPVPDRSDDPRPVVDFYTSCALKYPDAQDVYLMLPAAFYHWGENEFPATFDVQLLTSRDGIRWQRAGDRRPFLRQGPDDSATAGIIVANPWLVPVGDELWLYYSGRGGSHAEKERDGRNTGLFRATMRRDGFISADAGYSGGEFTTPPLRFGGDYLELNLDGSAGGWLKVEIQDAAGRPLPGYGLADADAVLGNAIRRVVTWQGRRGVEELAGRPVKLRFVMRDMKLYAFQFPQHPTD